MHREIDQGIRITKIDGMHAFPVGYSYLDSFESTSGVVVVTSTSDLKVVDSNPHITPKR